VKTVLYIVVALGAIAVFYGLYRAVRKPPKAVVAEELMKREAGIDLPQGMGPHASAQDPTWVNRETHGNMG
jgi:hypothetical protein